jgi:hypothetical protein
MASPDCGKDKPITAKQEKPVPLDAVRQWLLSIAEISFNTVHGLPRAIASLAFFGLRPTELGHEL